MSLKQKKVKFKPRIKLNHNNSTTQKHSHRPFLSCHKPLFQIKAKCKVTDMKMIFILMQMKLISPERFCTWPRFEGESFWNLEMA